jgi:hypothetical protein
LIRLASDQEYEVDPIKNLCEHVLHGTHENRILAIEGLGILRVTSTFPLLTSILSECSQSLLGPPTPINLPGSAHHALHVASEICFTLARFDCLDPHTTLTNTCNKRGNPYLRAAAISATGIESNWHDERLISHYLSHGNPIYRVAATNAIFMCTGLRQLKYKSLVINLLMDQSPCVVIAAVEVSALYLNQDRQIQHAFGLLLSDKRFCRQQNTTVSQFVSSYLDA